jgi:catechol 2,3-dioxygenase-like lactoylglutathione lyase family enzyme
MNLALSHCFVTVHDPDTALAFYRDVLGLELRDDQASDGYRWVTLSPRSQPEVEVVLVEPRSGRSGDGDGDALVGLLSKGSLPGVTFRTEDVDAMFEKVRSAGAEVLQEPLDQPYGVRECAFRDPSGNTVGISQLATR